MAPYALGKGFEHMQGISIAKLKNYGVQVVLFLSTKRHTILSEGADLPMQTGKAYKSSLIPAFKNDDSTQHSLAISSILSPQTLKSSNYQHYSVQHFISINVSRDQSNLLIELH